jgi:hypothetical protein
MNEVRQPCESLERFGYPPSHYRPWLPFRKPFPVQISNVKAEMKEAKEPPADEARGSLACVPSMFDSLGVQVSHPA